MLLYRLTPHGNRFPSARRYSAAPLPWLTRSFPSPSDCRSRDPAGIGVLVNLLYEQGRNEEAQRYIAMLDDQESQLSTHTKRLQAQDMLSRGELEEGMKHFRQIAENSPDYRDHLRLGQILAAFAQKALLADDTDLANKHREDAEKSLRTAVKLAPEEEAVWLSLVQFLNRSGKESEALQTISEARDTVAKDRLPLVLALCYQSLGRRLEAEQQFLSAVANSDGNDHAARYLVDFYLRTQKLDEAEKLLAKIIDKEQKASADDIAWARRSKAALLYSKSGLPNRRDAIALIDENLKDNPSSVPDIREKARLLATFSMSRSLSLMRRISATIVSGSRRTCTARTSAGTRSSSTGVAATAEVDMPV